MALLHRPALPFPNRLALPFGRLGSARWLLALVTAVLVVIAGLQVNQFSRLTSAGYEINDLNRQRAARQAENQAIEAEVAKLSSLANVDIIARVRLRMEPPRQKLYLAVNQPVPGRAALPTRVQQAAAATSTLPVAAAGDPVWTRLLRRLPFF